MRQVGALIGVFFLWVIPVWAATLENPTPGAIKSGVGLVSGWICDVDELEISFDGGSRLFVPYGSERADTQGVCGDTDNGFGLLINYNNLGDGPHTATLYADGMVATQVDFNVQTLGTTFLRGVTGQGTIALSDGKQVSVQWEETTQGFTITSYTTGGGTTTPSADIFHGTWRVTECDFGPDLCDRVWKIIQKGSSISIVEHWTEDESLFPCRAISSSRFEDLVVTGDTLTGDKITDTTSFVCGFWSSMDFTISADGNSFSGTYREFTLPECRSSYSTSGTITGIRTDECS